MSTATATPTKSATTKSAAGGDTGKKAAPAKQTHNLFTGIGRLGRDPEMRYTGDGRAWVKTSLAIYQGQDKEPLWLDLKAFAQPLDKGDWDERVPLALAELKKGQKISVRGKSVLRQARLQRQGIRGLGPRALPRARRRDGHAVRRRRAGLAHAPYN